MNNKLYKALVVSENSNGFFKRELLERDFSFLPANDVLIRVRYSSLNFKDALSAHGNKGVSRHYPHTPGIDAAGVVENCTGEWFKPGDKVIVTGYDLGMNTPGGFSQYIQVPHEWVIHCPERLTLSEAMMLGTAGFTAAYAMYKLISCGQSPTNGPVLVTGATGGVGSLAVNLLSKAGFEVMAATGKPAQKDYLKSIGATTTITRSDTNDNSGKALLKWRWAGAIDTVGGNILATALKACKPHGNVACLGNALSPELITTVYPFILNGVNLLGIDSATCPLGIRSMLWDKLSDEWKPTCLETIATSCSLEELDHYITQILQGNIVGRKFVVID